MVLAIESTCDETACAVVRDNKGGVEVLANVTASSAEILSKYGGIIPEVAAREQVASIVPVMSEALQKAQIFNNTPSPRLRRGASPTLGAAITGIDAVAVAYGPGLIGSLLIGIETAKALALAWNKPLIKVNHMAAHVFANWIIPSTGGATVPQRHSDTPELPAVGLVVSGGHTELILIKSLDDWQWLGGTRDDAAGEAYDKAARALGLPYPGGPEISRLAEKANEFTKLGSYEFKLPRPMISEDNLEMSFSGLKTALIQVISKREKGLSEIDKILLASEFNQAVTEVLVAKTMKAVEIYQPKSVLLAGGVAANSLLRRRMAEGVKNSKLQKLKLFVPELKYCGDNAAMIGAAAILRPDYVDPLLLKPEPGLGVV